MLPNKKKRSVDSGSKHAGRQIIKDFTVNIRGVLCAQIIASVGISPIFDENVTI